MNSLYLLIPLGLVVLAGIIAAFFWAVGSGQFDDLDSPALSVVLDDDRRPAATSENDPNRNARTDDQ